MDCLRYYILWTTLRDISIGPPPTIDIFICGLPSDVYQLGRLRRLIFLVWITLRSFLLFLANPPRYFTFTSLPSETFSLDSSHALTPIVLGCSNAYGMHVCQFQYSLIHMQIYKHKYIHIKIKSHNHVM